MRRLVLVASLLVAGTGCDQRATPATAPIVDAAPPTVTAPLGVEARAQAEAAVDQNCQICHSIDLVQSQRLGRAAWDKELKKMIGWGAPVPPEEVNGMLALLAAEYGAGTPAAGPPLRMSAVEVLAAVALDEPKPGGDIEHGAALYKVACASCHGATGAGGPIGPALIDRPIVHRAHEFETIVRVGRRRMPAVPLDAKSTRDLLAFLHATHG